MSCNEFKYLAHISYVILLCDERGNEYLCTLNDACYLLFPGSVHVSVQEAKFYVTRNGIFNVFFSSY